jgi:hypothetical protein
MRHSFVLLFFVVALLFLASSLFVFSVSAQTNTTTTTTATNDTSTNTTTTTTDTNTTTTTTGTTTTTSDTTTIVTSTTDGNLTSTTTTSDTPATTTSTTDTGNNNITTTTMDTTTTTSFTDTTVSQTISSTTTIGTTSDTPATTTTTTASDVGNTTVITSPPPPTTTTTTTTGTPLLKIFSYYTWDQCIYEYDPQYNLTRNIEQGECDWQYFDINGTRDVPRATAHYCLNSTHYERKVFLNKTSCANSNYDYSMYFPLYDCYKKDDHPYSFYATCDNSYPPLSPNTTTLAPTTTASSVNWRVAVYSYTDLALCDMDNMTRTTKTKAASVTKYNFGECLPGLGLLSLLFEYPGYTGNTVIIYWYNESNDCTGNRTATYWTLDTCQDQSVYYWNSTLHRYLYYLAVLPPFTTTIATTPAPTFLPPGVEIVITLNATTSQKEFIQQLALRFGIPSNAIVLAPSSFTPGAFKLTFNSTDPANNQLFAKQFLNFTQAEYQALGAATIGTAQPPTTISPPPPPSEGKVSNEMIIAGFVLAGIFLIIVIILIVKRKNQAEREAEMNSNNGTSAMDSPGGPLSKAEMEMTRYNANQPGGPRPRFDKHHLDPSI